MFYLDRVYTHLRGTDNTNELKTFSFLHYEKLTGNRKGQSSVRINNSYVERIIFREEDNGITVCILELDSNHYGKKR